MSILSPRQREFIRKMSLKKAYNISLVLLSYYISKFFKRNWHRGMPFSLSVEPTTHCNLRCPECLSGLRAFTRPRGMLGEELFQKTLDELGDYLLYLNFYFQGEPYLHPQFLPMVQQASQKGIFTSTSSNAHYLDDARAKATVESGLNQLIISLDGTTQESYASYRIGGSLEKVLKGTENLVRWKKKLGSSSPHIILQFLVVKPNEHQIEEVKTLAKKLEVDQLLLKSAQIYDFENGSDLMPEQAQYSRYRKNEDGRYSIKNPMKDECWRMWHSAVMTWDGKVVPCCFDKDAHFNMGSLEKESFPTIWRSKAYQAFRTQILKARSEIEMCQNCTEGMETWV